MALVKFGNGIAALSGRIDGTVFSRVRGGAVARGWTKPVSTPTAAQIAVRSSFATVTGLWSALTGSQRSSWNAQALTAERLNRLGESYTPSGRQMFIEANKNLSLAGMTEIELPPANWLLPSPPISVTLATAAETAGELTAMTLNLVPPADASAGQRYIVDMTPAFAPETKTNLTNLFRLIYFGVSGTTVDVLDLYDSIFGSAAIAGQAIVLRASSVDDGGMRSTFTEGKFIITGGD
jgi:hypothetical protein